MTDLPDLYEPLRRAWVARGWPWLAEPARLNLVGVRAASDLADPWDDWVCAAYVDAFRRPHVAVFEATTDPGRSALAARANPNGTAVVCPGYYARLWTLGRHKGEYPALVQVGAINVWRDTDGDAVLRRGGTVWRDARGINLHHGGDTVRGVGPWSAGCQVVRARADLEALLVLEAAHRAAGGDTLHGYGLVDLGEHPWLARLPWPVSVRGLPTLQAGDLGPDVAELQRLLVVRGERISVDSEFGGKTTAAVRRVQADAGLDPDGVVGPLTWAALRG